MDALSEGMEASSESWTSFMELYEEKESILHIFAMFLFILFTQRFTNLNWDSDADTQKNLNPYPDPLSLNPDPQLCAWIFSCIFVHFLCYIFLPCLSVYVFTMSSLCLSFFFILLSIILPFFSYMFFGPVSPF
jgi:hypothetical protein